MRESRPRSGASISLGNLGEMRILRAHPRTTGWKTLRWGPELCVLRSPPGDSDAHSSLGTTVLDGPSGLYNQPVMGFHFSFLHILWQMTLDTAFLKLGFLAHKVEVMMESTSSGYVD